MEIWEDIAANADDGAKRLVAEYGDRLFSAAVCICGNESDAEDLVFRTLSHAIAKIGQYGKRCSFKQSDLCRRSRWQNSRETLT